MTFFCNISLQASVLMGWCFIEYRMSHVFFSGITWSSIRWSFAWWVSLKWARCKMSLSSKPYQLINLYNMISVKVGNSVKFDSWGESWFLYLESVLTTYHLNQSLTMKIEGGQNFESELRCLKSAVFLSFHFTRESLKTKDNWQAKNKYMNLSCHCLINSLYISSW